MEDPLASPLPAFGTEDARRIRGLLIGVEFDGSARPVVNQLRHRGVLVGATGPHDNVLKIRPPLVFTPQQADLLLAQLADALRSR